LPAEVFTALDGVASNAEFESAAATLLPSLNDGVTREIFETGKFASRRLQTLRDGRTRGIWGEVFGRTAEQDSSSTSVAGYDADTFGIAVGAALPLTDTLTGGVNITYASIDIGNDGAGNAQADVDSYRVAGTLGYRAGAVFANGELGYSVSSVDTSRSTVAATVSGDYDVEGFDASVTAGYDFNVGGATITPTAGLRYARYSADDFTENGGLNLRVDQDDAEYLEGVIGLSAKTTAQLGDVKVTPSIRGAYVYDFIGDERTLTASFAGASPVELRSDDPSQSRFELGLGLDAQVSERVSLGLGYEGAFASDYQSHGGFLRLSVKF
jgi:outer membrane autotransporter protein